MNSAYNNLDQAVVRCMHELFPVIPKLQYGRSKGIACYTDINQSYGDPGYTVCLS